MKATITVSLTVLCALSFAAMCPADIISTGQGTGAASGQYKALYRTVDSKGNEVYKSHTIWGTGLNTAIDNGDEVTQHFAACVDLLTTFKSGTEYQAYNLFDEEVSFMSDQQKRDIVSLVSHTYDGLFTDQTNWRGDVVMVSANIRAFQFALWEILMEDELGYDLYDGWFQLVGANNDNETYQGYLDEATELATSWLNAVSDTTGALWDEMGYQAVDYDYTIWIAEGGKNASQSLITVDPAATPEPASMLIFGAGLIGLGVVRRRSKNALRS